MTMKRYPYLVIEKDGAIQGYAYAGAFVGRAAYDWSCELTVYLDHTAQKCGLGRKIYEALENRLSEMGILNLYACIGYPRVEDEYLNSNSAEFHAHLGFSKVGEFYKCGYKFGRCVNSLNVAVNDEYAVIVCFTENYAVISIFVCKFNNKRSLFCGK